MSLNMDIDRTPAMSRSLALLLNTPVVIAAIIISGIGGTFQFGICLSVMTSPSMFIKEFVNRTCVQRYNVSLEEWQVSLIWSFTMSIFSIGGLLGSLAAGALSTAFGRKKCMWFNNFVAISGALLMLLSKTAKSFEMIMVGRFLYGINTGLNTILHMTYVVECTPKRLRGMVGVTACTFISIGKLCAQLLGMSELLGTDERWQWLLGFNGLPALLQLLTLPLLPESPHYLLLHKDDSQGCEKALRQLWGHKDHSVEMEEMLEQHAKEVRSHTVMELIRNQTLRWQLLTIIVTFTVMQLCGANAVFFYSHEVFRGAGLREDQSRYVALGTSLCEVSTSFVCFMILNSIGRKVLIYGGYMCMSATLGLLTVTLYLQHQVQWLSYCSVVLVYLFICFFSCGPAALTPPLPGEIFNQSFQSAAYTIAGIVHWLGMFLLGMLFPIIVEHFGSFCFLIFLFFCLAGGLFVKFHVPETKHCSMLEITAEFQKMHCKRETSQKRQSTVQKAW
ncbi:solute carrier family 2, facilitated glucose transporter member 5-like [Genypterus blacodes]|uniref:solute carrier family 2, facilitated glucose transporter member 5-like n=1 Tax=Genypterus blacodes TaxID=154954 RepID=UPI003F76D38D